MTTERLAEAVRRVQSAIDDIRLVLIALAAAEAELDAQYELIRAQDKELRKCASECDAAEAERKARDEERVLASHWNHSKGAPDHDGQERRPWRHRKAAPVAAATNARPSTRRSEGG